MTTTEQTKLLSVHDFHELSNVKKIAYINSQYNLKDNYLVGKVRPQFKNQNFFFVENLVNPYTGQYIDFHLFNDVTVNHHAFCPGFRLEENNLRADDLILFRFEPNLDFRKLKEGSALIVTKQTIIPIESSADVIRELQLPAEDLMKINLDLEIDKIGYISDFYRNDVVTILNEKSATLHEQATQIQNEKEAIQEKLHQLEQRQ